MYESRGGKESSGSVNMMAKDEVGSVARGYFSASRSFISCSILLSTLHYYEKGASFTLHLNKLNKHLQVYLKKLTMLHLKQYM